MEAITRKLTEEELNSLYGTLPGKPLNTCYQRGEHFYMQRENDVLHCYTDNVINDLHVGYLSVQDVEKIPYETFKLKMREIIYNLNISKFWET